MTVKTKKQDGRLDVWIEIMHEIREDMAKEVKGGSTKPACNSQTVTVNQFLLCLEAWFLVGKS